MWFIFAVSSILLIAICGCITEKYVFDPKCKLQQIADKIHNRFFKES